MKTKEEIKKQLEQAYEHLERINKDTPIGKGEWRAHKRYIQALEWVLSCSETRTIATKVIK